MISVPGYCPPDGAVVHSKRCDGSGGVYIPVGCSASVSSSGDGIVIDMGCSNICSTHVSDVYTVNGETVTVPAGQPATMGIAGCGPVSDDCQPSGSVTDYTPEQPQHCMVAAGLPLSYQPDRSS